MRDTWILGLTFLAMIAALLTGQALRGDFTHESVSLAVIASDLDSAAIGQDGVALININAVDAETLTRLDGIGEVLAQRIVDYRTEHGPFASLDELLKVKGVGEKTLDRIRDRLVCLSE